MMNGRRAKVKRGFLLKKIHCLRLNASLAVLYTVSPTCIGLVFK